jgi:hypothetical protein
MAIAVPAREGLALGKPWTNSGMALPPLGAADSDTKKALPLQMKRLPPLSPNRLTG